MSVSLAWLREGAGYHIEPANGGFAIVKSPRDDADGFDCLVREVLASAGEEFVALPRSGHGPGYDGVFILPFD